MIGNRFSSQKSHKRVYSHFARTKMAAFSKMQGASNNLRLRFIKAYIKESVKEYIVRFQRITSATFDILATTPGESKENLRKYTDVRSDFFVHFHEDIQILTRLVNRVEGAGDVKTANEILSVFASHRPELSPVVYDDYIRSYIVDVCR